MFEIYRGVDCEVIESGAGTSIRIPTETNLRKHFANVSAWSDEALLGKVAKSCSPSPGPFVRKVLG